MISTLPIHLNRELLPLSPLKQLIWSIAAKIMHICLKISVSLSTRNKEIQHRTFNCLSSEAFAEWRRDLGKYGFKVQPLHGYCVGMSLVAAKEFSEAKLPPKEADLRAYHIQRDYGDYLLNNFEGDLFTLYRKAIAHSAQQINLKVEKSEEQSFNRLKDGSYLIQTADHVMGFFVKNQESFFYNPDTGLTKETPNLKNYELLTVGRL